MMQRKRQILAGERNDITATSHCRKEISVHFQDKPGASRDILRFRVRLRVTTNDSRFAG